VKSNYLLERNKKKKVHITPAQQMLNRLEAMQKAASSSGAAAVKQSSSTDSVAVKQHSSHADVKDDNSAVVDITCAAGRRVAHKPKLASTRTLFVYNKIVPACRDTAVRFHMGLVLGTRLVAGRQILTNIPMHGRFSHFSLPA